MGRILFFVLLVLAIYVAWRYMRVQQRTDAGRPPPRSESGRDKIESIVRCDVCGLNLPQSDALQALDGRPQRWYCCEEHRRQGSAQQ